MSKTNAPTTIVKTFTDPDFWIDAAIVIGGYKACDVVNTFLASRMGFLPGVVQPFVGPVVVVGVAVLLRKTMGGRIARNLVVGASVHAVDSLLGFTPIPGLKE